MEIIGERLAHTIARRKPSADIYHRRTDNAVVIDRQPLARFSPNASGQPGIMWNQLESNKTGLQKQDILEDLAKAVPQGAGEVSWSS